MKKLTTHEILSLIKEEESRYLDFKLQHHDNSAELIHDILCLSNSDYSGDRYILFGIDDDKKIHGIANNKKQADLVDCLRSSNFNILPTLSLYSIDINKVKIDIIHIANSPNKPIFY